MEQLSRERMSRQGEAAYSLPALSGRASARFLSDLAARARAEPISGANGKGLLLDYSQVLTNLPGLPGAARK